MDAARPRHPETVELEGIHTGQPTTSEQRRPHLRRGQGSRVEPAAQPLQRATAQHGLDRSPAVAALLQLTPGADVDLGAVSDDHRYSLAPAPPPQETVGVDVDDGTVGRKGRGGAVRGERRSTVHQAAERCPPKGDDRHHARYTQAARRSHPLDGQDPTRSPHPETGSGRIAARAWSRNGPGRSPGRPPATSTISLL